MRTIPVTLACCLIGLASAPLVLAHCGGSSASSPKTDAGPGSSSGFSSGGGNSSGGNTSSGGSSGDDGSLGSSSGSSGGTSGDDGSVGSSSGGSSSGGEGGTTSSSSSGGGGVPVPEGGVASDPDNVTCGGSPCNTTTDHCCETADSGTCQPLNGACAAGALSLECNEAADCAGGNVCCTALAYGQHATTCTAGACAPGTFQLCRTDSECGSADAGAASQKCIVQTCYTSQAMTQTVTVEACAYPAYGAGGTPGGGVPGGGVPGGGVPGGGTTTTWGPLPNCTAK